MSGLPLPRLQRCLGLGLVVLLASVLHSPAATAAGPAPRPAGSSLVRKVGLRKAAVEPGFVEKHRTGYAVQVPVTPIRDQAHSGRCWAFAWTKLLQTMSMAKGVAAEELSPAFINYHALRSLAHGAIDQALRTAERPQHNLYHLDGDMLAEGGWAHWANDIVKKHGIVPEGKMPSTSFDSRESDLLQNQIHRLVAAAYRDLDRTPEGATRQRQAIARQYKRQVDIALRTMIGVPPSRFTVDGKSYTPQTYRQDYLRLADQDLEFVTLTNDPTRAWNRRYREVYAGKGIPQNETYNVSLGTIKSAVRRTLKQGVAPNVAVNVDWDNPHRVADRVDCSSDANGILSLRAFGYDKLVPTPKLSKRDRMGHGVSLANHMMAITGYQPGKRGSQARWQIDNSHGTESFRGGRFDMYDDFFDHYVEEVTVPRSVLPKALLRKLESQRPLDAVAGMSIAPSRGGDRWTPTRKRMLVKALIRQELSFAEAAERYNLPVETVKSWYDLAKKAMLKVFGADPHPPAARQ